AEAAVDRVADIIARFQTVPKDHPWWGTNIESQSPFSLARLISKLNDTGKKLEDLSLAVGKVFAQLVPSGEPSISDAFATVKAFCHVAAVPEENRNILSSPIWLRDLAALESAIEEGERLAALVDTVESHFRPEAWSCDVAGWLLILRADGPSFLRRLI